MIVAIDGKCTSGKTTLASKLAEIYDCNVFHMDEDFGLIAFQWVEAHVMDLNEQVNEAMAIL